jgi:hypothetical protein
MGRYEFEFDHDRTDFLTAWRQLNREVADEMRRGVGHIRPPRVLFAGTQKTVISERARVIRANFRQKAI